MNTALKVFSLALTTALFTTGCSPSYKSAVESDQAAAGLRPLTQDERSSDLEILIQTFKEYYGPLKYKENRFGFKLDEIAEQYRKLAREAKSDDENIGVLQQFLARFHDGHISLQMNVQRNTRYSVPLIITPVEDKVLISVVTDKSVTDQAGIEAGDEVLAIDGQPPMSYLPTITKYMNFATPESDKHLVLLALRRPTYMTDLQPTKPMVALKIAKRDGSVIERTLVWKVEKNAMYVDREFPGHNVLNMAYAGQVAGLLKELRPASDDASIEQMGNEAPFFATPQVEGSFRFVRVTPSEKYLRKYGLVDLTKAPKLYAALYRHQGKSILLVRMATYSVKDAAERLVWYKGLLDEYGPLADVVIVDQTHNPGGSLDYAQGFTSLFATDKTHTVVNFLHADRKWLSHMTEELADPSAVGEQRNVFELGYKLVEEAYDKGLNLTQVPISLTGLDYIQPANFTLKKPVLMLIDELAGSCGDIVPMLMKDNGLATLFGTRTMGLGGNVEVGAVLPSSQAEIHLTRGFFFPFSPSGEYDMSKPTENNGVAPDIAYSHTVRDFRAGYVDYATAFSNAAAALVK